MPDFKCGVNSNNYVEKAEDEIKKLKKNRFDKPELTTSKIRNLLAMSSEIYNDALTEGDALSQALQDRINYLTVRMVYEAGRDNITRDFLEKSNLLTMIKEIGADKKTFILFSHYLEALVAYHKFYGGND